MSTQNENSETNSTSNKIQNLTNFISKNKVGEILDYAITCFNEYD